MAYVSFDSLNTNNTNSNNTNNQIGFFSLKNDGDEAIVRFMHDSTDSFEILGTHPITLNGRFRRCNCVRTPKDPIDKCPLCSNGENVEYRFYIHILRYYNNPDGSVYAEPQVWERSLSYANKLKEYINNYGPMSDIICKIVRHGRPGDMKTEYEIIPNLNKSIYKDSIFVKKDNLFDDYKALGRVVLDKTSEEIVEYLNTGNFPTQNSDQTISNTPITYSTPSSNFGTSQTGTSYPQWVSSTSYQQKELNDVSFDSEDRIQWSVDGNNVAHEDKNNPKRTTQAVPGSTPWVVNESTTISRPTRF